MVGSELRWAIRAVRARGWQAVLVVVLLAVAIAANTIVFSAADAFVFRRAPYPQSERLVVLDRDATGDFMSPGFVRGTSIAEWRRQGDVFSAVHAHALGGLLHAEVEGATEPIYSEQVTPGLLRLLGARLIAGRLIDPADAETGAPPVAVVGDDIAIRLFGSAPAAIGQRLGTGGSIEIVGVVDAAFRFPGARERIWRPYDISRLEPFNNIRNVAQLADGISFEQGVFAVKQRSEPILKAAGPGRPYPMTLRRLADIRENARYAGVLLMLLAAAACLLLIACANVASLELAAALGRGRAMAVHAALGAGRLALVRMRLLEAAILTTASAAAGAVLAWWGMRVLTASLPPVMAQQLANAIDFDPRAVGFMVAVAAAAWTLASLPAVWRASRADLMDVLRDDARLQASRAGAWARHALIVSQIAATVILLVGALLYVRSYAAKAGTDKGFDASTIATLTAYGVPSARLTGTPLREAMADLLSRHPAVEAFTRADNLLPGPFGGLSGELLLDGAPAPRNLEAMISYVAVAPTFFETMRIPILAGQIFDEGGPVGRVVVDEALARRFWPGQNPIGRRFGVKGTSFGRTRADQTGTFEVIGVARAVRPDRVALESGQGVFIFYTPADPAGTRAAFVLRMADPDRLADVVSMVRGLAPGIVVTGDPMEERYARLEGDRRLAAWATGGLGGLALIVATLGIYAVMAFIVSARTREIGIRMALGAGNRDIRRDVFAASLKYVAAGAVLGLVGALGASRLIEAQLFGVTATDPLTYAAVTAGVFAVATLATWRPAMAAMRVDPAIALRNQ
ncbi:MAG TPA: ABC transporter permease [Vicinamibacterales bacterium]|nr:ABC transporter permease [Vicinamibacterales bacterium]